MSDVYVVAVLGGSLGVITELLWHLVVEGERRVVGIEIWTTTHGRELLREDKLDHLGRLARAVPTGLPALSPLLATHDPAHAPTSGVLVCVPRDDDQDIPDCASAAETRAFSRFAHRRFATLREGPTVPLVASLAGGRKAMSAVLHSAFTLYADRHDRLVHVLVEPRFERALGAQWGAYAFPSDLSVVPLNGQLQVFEVPVFPVRAMTTGTEGEMRAYTLLQRWRHDLEQARAHAAGPPTIHTAPAARGCTQFTVDGHALAPIEDPYAWAWLEMLRTGDRRTGAVWLAQATEELPGRPPPKDEAARRRLRRFAADVARVAGSDPSMRAIVPVCGEDARWSTASTLVEEDARRLQRRVASRSRSDR